MHFDEIDKAIAWVFGMIGGCFAYINIPVIFLGISFADVMDKVVGLAWAGFVAIFTGGMGVFGKRLFEKYFIKRKSKNDVGETE